MFKDFFYYSKSQRKGLLILSILIIIVIASCWITSKPNEGPQSEEAAQWNKELADFKEGVTIVERRKEERRRKYQRAHQHPTLQNFDPNTADSATLTSLGLPTWMAHNILKYRDKGGKFYQKDDFKKIYGLNEELYAKLKPFIQIDTNNVHKYTKIRHVTLNDSDSIIAPSHKFSIQEKYPKGTIVELNTADTTILKMIPGIGSYRASQIVNYRKRLGGFHNLLQLEEIKLEVDSLYEWFSIDSTQIVRIPVNHLNVKQLMRHPYLNFYQAKAIVEYRKRKGNLKSLAPLKLYDEFTPNDFNRLRPYLSFEN